MATGIVRRAMVYLGLSDDEYEDYDAYEDAPVVAQPPRRVHPDPSDPSGQTIVSAVRPIPREPSSDPSSGVTISPRPAVVRPIISPQAAKVHVVAPLRFGDAKEIGDRFKDGQPVIVNLQTGDRELSRRMIDFCSGVTYALGGTMDKVADQVFLLTPTNVELSQDEKRKLQERGLFRS